MKFEFPSIRLLPALIAVTMIWSPASAEAQDLSLPHSSATSQPAADPLAPIPLTGSDDQITARLTRLFQGVKGLESVRATTRDGIVTLAGTTLSVASSRQAEGIAGRIAGVVAVNNSLVADRSVSRRLDPLFERTTDMTSTALGLLPLMAVALVVFVGFWLIGHFITRSTRLFKRLMPNEFIESIVSQIVRVMFILAGLVTAMSILGATALLGSVLGAAGVIGLAVGFAVRDTIENYIASVLLSIRQPFRPNDSVDIAGFQGRITRLNSRATILTTGDGNEVRIPNATVYKANIVNYTHTPERRFEFEIPIGLDSDIRAAMAIALKAARDVPGVLAKPEASVQVDRVDAEAIVVKVFGWVHQTRSDFGKTRGEAIRAVKEAFDADAVPRPVPADNMRHLPANVGRNAARKSGGPAAAALSEVQDTSADTTIEKQVRSIRGGAGEDLLAHGAPRE